MMGSEKQDDNLGNLSIDSMKLAPDRFEHIFR